MQPVQLGSYPRHLGGAHKMTEERQAYSLYDSLRAAGGSLENSPTLRPQRWRQELLPCGDYQSSVGGETECQFGVKARLVPSVANAVGEYSSFHGFEYLYCLTRTVK